MLHLPVMKIMGLDPGTARVGWGIIDHTRGKTTALAFGCITTPAGQIPEKRLATIYAEVKKLLALHTPDCVSVEQLFFSTNVTTAFAVGEARGVILLAAGQAKIPVHSYTPQTVKQTVTGSGRADKKQVQKMTTLTLRLPKIPTPDDTADALAIALTHAFSYTMKARLL